MKNKIDYVLGFAFNSDISQILLIRKNRPDWQKGKYNGVGGKILDSEKGKTSNVAMVREFEEETGLRTRLSQWTICANLWGNGHNDMIDTDWYMDVFAIKLSDGEFAQAISMTDELIMRFNVADLPMFHCISNLACLIPIAKATLNNEIDYNLLLSLK